MPTDGLAFDLVRISSRQEFSKVSDLLKALTTGLVCLVAKPRDRFWRCGAAIPWLHINATQTPRRRMVTSESMMLSPTALRERCLSGFCVPCWLYSRYCAVPVGSHASLITIPAVIVTITRKTPAWDFFQILRACTQLMLSYSFLAGSE